MGVQFLRPDHGVVAMFLGQVEHSGALVGRVAHRKMVERRPERVHVSPMIETGLGIELLRRHVVRRAKQLPHVGDARIATGCLNLD